MYKLPFVKKICLKVLCILESLMFSSIKSIHDKTRYAQKTKSLKVTKESFKTSRVKLFSDNQT